MLRYCLGQHLFEDGNTPITKTYSIDEFIEAVNETSNEQVVCKECWENIMKENETN